MAQPASLPRRSALAGALAATLPLPAIAQSARTTLRVRPFADLAHFDTLAGLSTISQEAAYMVFDSLYGLDASLVPQPQMVAGHDVSADGLLWRFTLRDQLRFHDGEPVLARDAVASISRWTQRYAMGLALRSRLAEIRTLDDRRFEIRLRRPFPLLTMGLSSNLLFVLPAAVAESNNAYTVMRSVNGSGPFIFEASEWQSGVQAVFRRNPRYVPRNEPNAFLAGSRAATLDRVEFVTIPDPATAVSALAKGEIDLINNVPIDLVPLLRATPGVSVAQNDVFGQILTCTFNTKSPPFDNPALRHALLTGLSQTDCMQAIVGDEAALMRTGFGVFTEGTPLATSAGLEILTAPRDLEATRRLVRESGYSGEPVIFISDHDGVFFQSTVVLDAMMRACGLKTDFQPVDNASIARRRNDSNPRPNWSCYCATINGLNYSLPGTHYTLHPNGGDAPLDRFIEDWFDAPDLAGQKRAAEAIQGRFFEAPPFLPLGQYFVPSAFRTGLTGFIPNYIMLYWGLRKAA